MKTSNKILTGYFGSIGMLCLINVFVCGHRFKTTLPSMRNLSVQFSSDTVRVVKIVDGGKKTGLSDYTVCVYSNGNERRSVSCMEYPAGVRISGDTLIVPSNLHFIVNSPKIERVILPGGESVSPPYGYLLP